MLETPGYTDPSVDDPVLKTLDNTQGVPDILSTEQRKLADIVRINNFFIEKWTKSMDYWAAYKDNYYSYVQGVINSFQSQVVVYDETEMQ